MGQGSFAGLAPGAGRGPDGRLPRASRWCRAGPRWSTPAPVGSAINTVGSSVMRNNFWRMRDAGADRARNAGAGGDERDGRRRPQPTTPSPTAWSRHLPSGHRATYGQVAAAAALLHAAGQRAAGARHAAPSSARPLPRQDIPSKVDGSASYGIDVRLPGMVYAVDQALPELGGTLAATPRARRGAGGGAASAWSPAPAAAPSGRQRQRGGRGGPNTWDAWQAAKRLTRDVERCRPTPRAEHRAVPGRRAGPADHGHALRRRRAPTRRARCTPWRPAPPSPATALARADTRVRRRQLHAALRVARLHGSAQLHGRLRARRALRRLGADAGRAQRAGAGAWR